MFLGKAGAKVDPFAMAEEKQMFSSIEVNIFVPKDPNELNEEYKIQDVLEDDPEQAERLTYHVSCESMNYVLENRKNRNTNTFCCCSAR